MVLVLYRLFVPTYGIFSSSEMDIQASLIILHKLDEKECHFLADIEMYSDVDISATWHITILYKIFQILKVLQVFYDI